MTNEKNAAKGQRPGPENVDYYSAEFLTGFEAGKAGHPSSPKYPEGTQAWFNYVEGWLMGDAERE
jgi:hypothetical protein